MKAREEVEEKKEIKPIHSMTTQELKDVIRENKGIYEKYKPYLKGKCVWAMNLPFYNPTHLALLNELESNNLIRRDTDWNENTRYYVANQLGLWALRGLYQYREAVCQYKERVAYAKQKELNLIDDLVGSNTKDKEKVANINQDTLQGEYEPNNSILEEVEAPL